MRAVRHPGSPEGSRAKLAALEARVRTLQAQLAAARQERDTLAAAVLRLQSDHDPDMWIHD